MNKNGKTAWDMLSNIPPYVGIGLCFLGFGLLALWGMLYLYFDPIDLLGWGALIAAVFAGAKYVYNRFFVLRHAQTPIAPTPVTPQVRTWANVVRREFVDVARQKLELPVGINKETGGWVYFAMNDQDVHLLVTGVTGSGKSHWLNLFCATAAISGLYQVVLIARNDKDYKLLEPLVNFHVYASKSGGGIEARTNYATKTIPMILERLVGEMDRRGQWLSGRGNNERNVDEVRADSRPPHIVVVFEELGNALILLETTDKAAYKTAVTHLTMLAQEARSVGIHIVGLTQRPMASIIPTNATAQLKTLTYQQDSTEAAFRATGIRNSGAERLQAGKYKQLPQVPAEALLVDSNGPVILNMPLVGDDEIQQVVATAVTKGVKDRGKPNWIGAEDSEVELVTTAISPITSPVVVKVMDDGVTIEPGYGVNGNPNVSHSSTYLAPEIAVVTVTDTYKRIQKLATSNALPQMNQDQIKYAFFLIAAGCNKTAVVQAIYGSSRTTRYFERVQALIDIWND